MSSVRVSDSDGDESLQSLTSVEPQRPVDPEEGGELWEDESLMTLDSGHSSSVVPSPAPGSSVVLPPAPGSSVFPPEPGSSVFPPAPGSSAFPPAPGSSVVSRPVTSFRTRLDDSGEVIFEFGSEEEDEEDDPDYLPFMPPNVLEGFNVEQQEARNILAMMELTRTRTTIADRIIERGSALQETAGRPRVRRRVAVASTSRRPHIYTPTPPIPIPSLASRTGRPKGRSKKKGRKPKSAKKKSPAKPRPPPAPKILSPFIIYENVTDPLNPKIVSSGTNPSIHHLLSGTLPSSRMRHGRAPPHQIPVDLSFIKRDENSNEEQSESESVVEVEEPSKRVEGYKIGEVIAKPESESSWAVVRNKQELKETYPGIIKFTLDWNRYTSGRKGHVHLMTEEHLSPEESAAKPRTNVKMSKLDTERPLLFILLREFKFEVSYIDDSTAEMMTSTGLGSKHFFRLEFGGFNEETGNLLFDVVVLKSIMGKHHISDIPYGCLNRAQLKIFYKFFKVVAPKDDERQLLKDPDEVELKEDIPWFYGQIKKYHSRELLPEPTFDIQSPSLIPELREYQQQAVHWMLYREGALGALPPQASSSRQPPRRDLLEAFMEKMYTPVNIQVSKKTTKLAYFCPMVGYVSWSKPQIPSFPTGGILADEMGLGKTVEILSLILLNKKPADFEDGTCVSQFESSIIEHSTKPDSEYADSDNCEENSDSASVFVNPSKRKRASSPCEFTATNFDSDYEETEAVNSQGSISSRKSVSLEENEKSVKSTSGFYSDFEEEEEILPVSKRARLSKNSTENSERSWSNNKSASNGFPATESIDQAQPAVSDSKSTVVLASTSSKGRSRKSSPRKKITLYDKVKHIYDAALHGYSEAKEAKVVPRFNGTFYDTFIPKRPCFECVCGRDIDDFKQVVICQACGSSQHAQCVSFDKSVQERHKSLGRSYLCPHCANVEAPFPAKATLIVTPSTISYQWIDEIQRHVRNEKLNILFYKGVAAQGYIPPAKLANYDLVITTYSVLSSELDYANLPHSNSDSGRKLRNPKRFLTTPTPLHGVYWWRVCLDEAQMIEGIGTKMSMMAMRLQTVHRWCITGTPINEGLEDLFGLFAFLGVQPVSLDYWWAKLVKDPFLRKDVSLLYELFGQFVWRTGKSDVLDQLGIPPQEEVKHWLNFSPVETHFYKQQYEICSNKIIDKINQFCRREYDQDVSQYYLVLLQRLADLDRKTLNSLLQPFLELRQACCHPQMVKGQLISLQKGTLTMEQLLEQLVKKTGIQCADDHRLMVSAQNGMAGLHIINEEWIEASEKYREVLQSAEKHAGHFSTDSLQLLHTLENLADLLDRQHEGIPFTLRDSSLRQQASDLKAKYLSKYADGVRKATEATSPLTNAVEAFFDKFKCERQSWWAETLIKAAKLLKIDDLIQRIKDDVVDHTKKNNKNITIANKFNDATGLQHVLIENITGTETLRQTVLEGLEELKSESPEVFVSGAVFCHLRKGKGSDLYYKDADEYGFRCKLCQYHDKFLQYESMLFREEKKTKVFRTGRKWQQQKLMGGVLASDLTEAERNLALMKEEEELLESLGDVNANLSNELRRGTWADSDVEKALKLIHSFSKLNGLSEMVVHDGTTHLKLFDAMKKEFRVLRILWRQIYDQISAWDELSQATTRLRLRSEAEQLPTPSTSTGSAKRKSKGNQKPKELKSTAMEDAEKIENINVLERHELETRMAQMNTDFAIGKDTLGIHMGQLLYLGTLKKNGYGKKGTVNSEDCPICQAQLGMEWSVLRCGHSFCSDCVKKMLPNTLSAFLCPLCRHSMKYKDVSFVDTKENESNGATDIPSEFDKDRKEVKGSHSTKVGAIVQTLLKLQETHPREKALVFSSWTGVLELIGRALDQNDIKHCLLNQPAKAFQENLAKFKSREDIQVLLMPLQSGSKGLNIIEASHVLLVEPILNTASELQAIGRVHRIGQTKRTYIHRFYVRKTIEEQLHEILKCYDVTSDDEGSLTIGDLKNLIQDAGNII